jgi:hypothetical protein
MVGPEDHFAHLEQDRPNESVMNPAGNLRAHKPEGHRDLVILNVFAADDAVVASQDSNPALPAPG